MVDIIKKIEEIAKEKYEGIINSSDCYVKNAIDAFQLYINYKIENQDIEYLINNLEQESSIKEDANENITDDEQEKFNLNFSKRFEKICKTGNQKKFVNILYNLIAQVDMNAANKSQYNPNGIVAIGKTGIRQNMWVENLLKYKRDNNDSNINSNNIKNCIVYLNNPEDKYPILQEDHYIKIEKYIPELLTTDWNICKNKMNNTYLIKEILYRDMEIRDLWDKKELKDLETYEVACVTMYILYKQENKILCTFDDLKKCQFTKEVLKIQKKRNFQFPSVIEKRVNTLKNPNIIIENNEYKLTNEGLNNSEKLYKELNLNYVTNNEKEDTIMEQPLNQILYGPPGTGKTYNTVVKAISIIDNKNYTYDYKNECYRNDIDDTQITYQELLDRFKKEINKKSDDNSKRIEFVTFHQSYSYEEFVEGIKPDLDNSELKYIREDGIFKRICDNAATKVSNDFEEIYAKFISEFDENYEFKTLQSSFKVRINEKDGLTIRTGDNFDIEKSGTITKEQIKNQTYTSEGRRTKLETITKYLQDKYGLKFNQNKQKQPYVLIIDEINRGDVSKIFGELITLIESDKRIGGKYEMKVTLPYSKEPFGVPDNLYIIGTMNTADRSIALLDTALRRRFDFEEIMPRPALLNNKVVEGTNINLQTLLVRINERITNKYDRDHQIGHSYLMGVNTKEQLERAYKNRILPLLNEYFYNESKTVAEILNCSEKELNEADFITILNKAQNEAQGA